MVIYFYLNLKHIKLKLKTPVITGQKILQNPSCLISFSENSYYSTLLSKFDFELRNSSYSLLGLKSNSTAYNESPCFIFLLLLMWLHIFISICWWWFVRINKDGRWSCIIKLIAKATEKIFQMLTFTVYKTLINKKEN